MPMPRKCTDPTHAFSITKTGWRCLTCHNARERERRRVDRKQNPEKYRASVRHWQERHPERHRERMREYNHQLRQDALDHYGDMCAVCHETNESLLCIDHVNDDGVEHRAAIGSSNIYPWLKKHDYPEGFQTLCQSCNSRKANAYKRRVGSQPQT